jgi:hypothetical protein
MKKLLLLMIACFGMVGVGSASTFTQTFGRQYGTLATQTNYFDGSWISCSLPSCVLVQAQNNRYLSSTTDICGNAYILSTT